jgi:hypothetical protein
VSGSRTLGCVEREPNEWRTLPKARRIARARKGAAARNLNLTKSQRQEQTRRAALALNKRLLKAERSGVAKRRVDPLGEGQEVPVSVKTGPEGQGAGGSA